MAKITKTKFEVEVEHSGDQKDFEKLFLKTSRRLKQYKTRVIESETKRISKPKEVTQVMQDTQTIKTLLMEVLKSMGYAYIAPSKWYNLTEKNIFTIKANNVGYYAPGIEIMAKTDDRKYGYGKSGYIKISNNGNLEFRRYHSDKFATSVNLADPNVTELIKKALKKRLGI